MHKHLTLIVLAFMLSTPASAAMRTVTLAIPGMTCAACPITVRTALKKVDGVHKVDVNAEQRLAVVTFDDAVTHPQALRVATERAGYPSTLKP